LLLALLLAASAAAQGVARVRTTPCVFAPANVTNLVLYSEELDNAAWTKTNATITADQVQGPNGGLVNADKVIATTSAVTEVRQDVVVASANVVYSVYAKKGSGAADANKFHLRNQTTATNLVAIALDYDTGLFSYTTGSSGASVTYAGNGWWRIAITAGITSGNSVRVGAGFNGASETANEYAYITGAQVEAGTVPSLYARTTSAAVVRNAGCF
jgi:hypothetical protein